ncbi:MAG: hypothetical protein IJV15_00100 [Lachnospiraceae bacterium]|nr:hypothetical protein [Lachnospiraceae bacterium]
MDLKENKIEAKKLSLFDRVRLKMMMPNLDKYRRKYSDKKVTNEEYVLVKQSEYELMKKVTERQDNYIEQIKINNKELQKQQDEISELSSSIENVLEQLKIKESERRKSAGKAGGLTAKLNSEKKENEKLKEEVEELKDKLAESMTDKYLVKKIPSGRRPRTQVMKLKSCTVQSNIARKMFERGK